MASVGGGGSGGAGSAAASSASAAPKGRQMEGDGGDDGRYAGAAGVFESVEATEARDGPAKSKEGWVIFVTGVHDEACEDDVLDKFNDYGKVRSINLNLDRQTGFAKGYALIEYATQREAEAAISGMNGQQLLGEEVRVTWTFIAGAVSTSTEVRDSGRSGGGGRRGGSGSGGAGAGGGGGGGSGGGGGR